MIVRRAAGFARILLLVMGLLAPAAAVAADGHATARPVGIAPAATTGTDIAADVTEYKLGTGDKIRIQVYGEKDLYEETTVSDRGTISYPFLGELHVAGLTPSQLQDLITRKLKGPYLVNPKVSVDIMEYRPFYVNGEVEKPGGFPFEPGITVRKAISIAGGFKERASPDKIYIIRGNDPNRRSIKVTLDQMVRPGDIITVQQSFF